MLRAPVEILRVSQAALQRSRTEGKSMELFDLVQWPAMLVTVAAAWLVASSHKRKRLVGFWLFLFSNALWAAWGLHTDAYALIVLQVCLAAMNVRGALKAEPSSTAAAEPA